MSKFAILLVIILVVPIQLQSADFKKALGITLKIEGGYANDKNDNGKETYCGISRHFHPNWKGWVIIDRVKLDLGINDSTRFNAKVGKSIEKLFLNNTEAKALIESFYKNEFWDPLKLDSESSQEIANKLFDIAVNMGVSTAKKFYREAIENTQ